MSLMPSCHASCHVSCHAMFKSVWFKTRSRGGSAVSKMLRNAIFVAALCLISVPRSAAQTSYYRHTFFDNGLKTSGYYYSIGKAVAPSTVELQGQRLPLDSQTFFTPPNSIRLAWKSNPGGSWLAELHVL